jgi:hypothetical protein
MILWPLSSEFSSFFRWSSWMHLSEKYWMFLIRKSVLLVKLCGS